MAKAKKEPPKESPEQATKQVSEPTWKDAKPDTLGIICNPFDEKLVETIPGKSNKKYVPWPYYLQKLNKATQGKFDCVVIAQGITETEVWVHVRLTIPGLGTRDGFSGHKREEKSELGDCLASAYSRAMCGACSKFGMALNLYERGILKSGDYEPATESTREPDRRAVVNDSDKAKNRELLKRLIEIMKTPAYGLSQADKDRLIAGHFNGLSTGQIINTLSPDLVASKCYDIEGELEAKAGSATFDPNQDIPF